jgi:hypothetical protein
MNKNLKRQKQYYWRAIPIAILSIIIGEIFHAALQHTGAAEISIGIYWLFFTIAVFVINPQMIAKKIDIVIGIAFLIALVAILRHFSLESIYATAGIIVATIPGYYLTKRLNKIVDNKYNTL